MASRDYVMFDSTTKPDTSGGVYQQPFSVEEATKWDVQPFWFNNSGAQESLLGTFHVPSGYIVTGTTLFIPVWSTATTTASAQVRLSMDYRSVGGNDSESMDQATAQETVAISADKPTAAWNRLIPEMSATAANFASGDTVEWEFSRISDHADDDLADKVGLWAIIFRGDFT